MSSNELHIIGGLKLRMLPTTLDCRKNSKFEMSLNEIDNQKDSQLEMPLNGLDSQKHVNLETSPDITQTDSELAPNEMNSTSCISKLVPNELNSHCDSKLGMSPDKPASPVVLDVDSGEGTQMNMSHKDQTNPEDFHVDQRPGDVLRQIMRTDLKTFNLKETRSFKSGRNDSRLEIVRDINQHVSSCIDTVEDKICDKIGSQSSDRQSSDQVQKRDVAGIEDFKLVSHTAKTELRDQFDKESVVQDEIGFSNQIDKNNTVSGIHNVQLLHVSKEIVASNINEVDTIENLSELIEKLTGDEPNWVEPLSKISKIIRGQTDEKLKSECVAMLIKNGFARKLQDYLVRNSIHSISELKSETSDRGKRYWPVVKRCLVLLWIACDQSVNFCQHIIKSDIFKFLVSDLKILCVSNYTESELATFTTKSILGILHNICRHVPNGKWKLRNDGLVSVVRLFLVSEVPMVRLKSLIILSYILSEAENEMINSDDDNFIFIFRVLRDALKSSQHKSSKHGMSVIEVLKGLNNLAINDENKIRIVRNGGLPLFEEVLESGSLDEAKVTITTLWCLAFHHYNKVKMREMPGITSKLYEFYQCEDDEICHAARGTIWELENMSRSTIGSSLPSSMSADKDPSQPHIMISYQWDSQSVMMKIKDRLRHAGYKVWMDIEHMTGSTLEAMALAVEKAAVVLVCMSQKYKDSPNCRTEAEYVYRLRKDFVPLRLQREYIPDGWLGILVGTRLYFDVYSEDYLDGQLPRLIRELRDRGKITPTLDYPDRVPSLPQRLTSRESVPMLHHPASPTVSNWTSLDVKHWMVSLGLDDIVDKFERIDGLLLLELKTIQETAPEYFHSILRKDFNIPVSKALKISRLLRQLT